MRSTFWNVMLLALGLLPLGIAGNVCAQGATTSAIHGTVHFQNENGSSDARVLLINVPTGYAIETRTRNGKFLVQGLVPGGPYRLLVTSLGYEPNIVSGIFLTLGERREIVLTLTAVATSLDTVRIKSPAGRSDVSSSGGIGTLISDSTLRRLPTVNRDLYDFIRLVPQVSTRLGLSGAGASFRFNGYSIDGVSDRQLQGNNVMGASTVGGRSISIEAIKEYEVLLAPYDARFGNFAGMLVNAVTKQGGNDMHGSSYGYFRNAQLARTDSFIGSSPFEREQFGFSVGGPVVRDRLHFFIATEIQRSAAPTVGPYIGQPASVSPAVPVREDDVRQFVGLLRDRGIDAGDGSRVTMLNPAISTFERIDFSFPEWKSRVVLRDDYSSVELTRFSRSDNVANFALTSNAWVNTTAKHTTAAQIFTRVSPGVLNEFIVARVNRPVVAEGYTPSPTVQVRVPSPDGSTFAQLIAGPPAPAGGVGSHQLAYEAGDQLTVQAGSSHSIGIGAHVERFDYHAVGVRGRFGQWKFGSLKDFAIGDPISYVITKDFGSAEASVRGAEPSAYLTDSWQITDRLMLTLGIRADALIFTSRGTYNPEVDSIFGRRTDDYPRAQVEWSPRFGFNWLSRNESTRLRGGAGVFVGPPPLGWMLGPLRSNGAGVQTLKCEGIAGSGKVPKFVADVTAQPQSCPGGLGFSNGPVAFVDRDLRMAKSFRTSLGAERRLPWGLNAGVEAMYSRVLSDFMFENNALAAPIGLGSHGRVMYGTIDTLRRSHPSYVSDQFTEVIGLRNHSIGHSWSLTTRLDRPFSDRYEVHAAYTFSRVRDLQSLTNGSAVAPLDIWAGGRPLSGRNDEMSAGISSFEIPHRVILAATYTAPWKQWSSDISFYYVGESGSPFTFNDSTSDGTGDLNADGTSANDPIYVPRSATDPSEIRFLNDTSGAQARAFEKFVVNTPCLSRQRGRIVARNSCRGPWVNTFNASMRQTLPAFNGHAVSLQAELFNVLNLLNSSWGLYRIPNDKALQHAGQTSGASSQPVFRFDTSRASSNAKNLESGYQIQLSLRYSF